MEQGSENISALAEESYVTVYEPPEGELEQAIAGIWQDVFRIKRVGRNDNFFQLGGDSLVGIELMETLAARLQIQLPVVTLFLNPTIREMAAMIAAPTEL